MAAFWARTSVASISLTAPQAADVSCGVSAWIQIWPCSQLPFLFRVFTTARKYSQPDAKSSLQPNRGFQSGPISHGFSPLSFASLYILWKSLNRGAQPNLASPKCMRPVKRKSPSPGLTPHSSRVFICPRQFPLSPVSWKTLLFCLYSLLTPTWIIDSCSSASFVTSRMEPLITGNRKRTWGRVSQSPLWKDGVQTQPPITRQLKGKWFHYSRPVFGPLLFLELSL